MEGRDNDKVRETFQRTGVSVMVERMFDLGEQQAWPEEAPFHTPVVVVRHEKREPWERPGPDRPSHLLTAPAARLGSPAQSRGSRHDLVNVRWVTPLGVETASMP